MAKSLVIRKGASLAKRNRKLRAAQYVRMSTDFQRYSIQNQAAAIAAFAQQNNLTIVRTYTDEGRSGLRIKGRAGLIELIDDVCSDRADFDHILVYDVSRWGRFQDVDESAHYEFLCKENGIKVAYCAEQFDNDGSLLSSIVKNIKRVMAAEFSRELSVKVHTGQCRVVSLGYRVGGPPAFGLRRELVDEGQQSKGLLKKGERKALQTDRVRLRLGSQEEAGIVRWIFHQFVVEKKSDAEIARQLNRANTSNSNGRAWTPLNIHTILKSENYIGNLVHNRTSRRLGQKLVNNPRNLWVRRDAAIDPIVDQDLFARAQRIMAERYLSMPDDQMLLRLRVLLNRRQKLSTGIINSAAGVPSSAAYINHFGSLRKAYALIGYKPPRDCDWIDTGEHWSAVLRQHAVQLAEGLSADKNLPARVDKVMASVTVNGTTKISFLTARQLVKIKLSHCTQWRLYRRHPLSGLLVVLRLDASNKTIEDYLLLPASKMTGPYLRFSNTLIHDATRADTPAELVANIKMKLNRSSTPRGQSGRCSR
jgi:DNA invertase Pin-like site-specific DNA recombinase